MEALVTPDIIKTISEFVDISKKDPKAELECKMLTGRIQTEDVANRILKAVQTLSIGGSTEEQRMTLSYDTGHVRVNVLGPQMIHKVCVQGSFRDVPILVERKESYFAKGLGKKDTVDLPDVNSRFTLKAEKELRRDWDGGPNDPKANLRIISRKMFKTNSELFRVDFSKVKSRHANSKQSIVSVLDQEPTYELEIEFVNKKSGADNVAIVKEYMRIMTVILQAYYETPFLLPVSDMERYQQEFGMTSNRFFQLITLERRHLNPEVSHNISEGYTVTNKADGERCGLYVARDRKVLRVKDKTFQVAWTGITARDDSHIGDFIDGEYIPDKNLFCIFDVYRYKNRDTRTLPLMTTDDDIVKNPTKSRLGCAKLFVEDLKTEFSMQPSLTPLRIETKLFLAGDGPVMEEAIRQMLKTEFEYEIDGLIFTPRLSAVAPSEDRMGNTWLRVYKWKPADQNSIDFLVRFTNDEVLGPEGRSKKGELYVTRNPGEDIILPRETLNGEYVPKKLPVDLQKIANQNTRVPSIFQPAAPRDPDAYMIYIPMDAKGIPVDKDGNRVKDNTIIECSYDIEKHTWTVLRTRYDKTYQYRVKREPMYGNSVKTADNVWHSIHVPIGEEMITSFASAPTPNMFDDDSYYNDNLTRTSRILMDIRDLHNRIKDDLYKSYVKQGDTLLELASGRDIMKWKKVKPAKVVAVDISLQNIEAPKSGAATRYILEKQKNPHDYLPPVLFLQGDMTAYPLFEQEDRYMPILTGKETAPTEYLAQFEGLAKFDSISCQFALHYACESEETFRSFAKNLEKYGKGYFFGTCSDGQAIYSLLMDKKTYFFGNDKHMFGEYTKQYLDKDTWTEEFGMPIKAFVETFEKPAVEYIVPFGKVTDILREHGYELIESKMFSELYSQQTRVTLTQEQQTFSFLNRSFVFKKMTRTERKEEEAKVEEPKEEPKEEPPKKRKLRKEKEPEEEPILFHGADESKGEHRNLSNMSQHPIEVDGTKYHTVEHYFQAMKAKEFNDEEIYNKILKAKTPKAAKALGKKVKNFTTEVWDAKRDSYIATGMRAKFVQHPELRKQLVETGEKMIGEADPRDTYWGIGTGIESEKSKSPSKWRGQNKIGKILMELRTTFRNET